MLWGTGSVIRRSEIECEKEREGLLGFENMNENKGSLLGLGEKGFIKSSLGFIGLNINSFVLSMHVAVFPARFLN